MISCRPTVPVDRDQVTSWLVTEPVGCIPADRCLAELAEGMYRPEWTSIAERDGQIVGWALWWGPKGSAHPVALDCLDVHPSVGDRTAVAAGLIGAAHEDEVAGMPIPSATPYNLNVGYLGVVAAFGRAGYRKTEVPINLSNDLGRS